MNYRDVIGQHGMNVITTGSRYSIPELYPVVGSTDDHTRVTLDDSCLRIVVAFLIVAACQFWLNTTGISLTFLIHHGNLGRLEEALVKLDHRGGMAHETTIGIAVLA